MTETKHTPTPYTMGLAITNAGLWQIDIHSSKGWVCMVHGNTRQEAEENAAFIVHAVNSYDPMKSALQKAMSLNLSLPAELHDEIMSALGYGPLQELEKQAS